MRYLSLCSGIEAASNAWKPLGWEAVGFSEIEPFPCAVLAHRFPNVPNYGDMTKYKEWNDVGQFDVLVGGTPCQSFSVAGLRKGLNDPRGNLMLTYGAIANHFKPRIIVWENVPGVLSSGGGRDFGTFLGMLGELGYGVAYRVLDAQYFGVAQRRRRVFVVGYLGDWRRAAQILFESESLRGDNPPSRKKREGVAGTISARTSGGGGLGTDFELGGGLQVAHTLRGEGFDASEDGTGRGTPIVPVAIQAGALRENPKSGPDGIGCQEHIAYTIEARAEVQAVCYDMRERGDGNTAPTLCTDHASRPSDYCPVVMATEQGNAEITGGHAPKPNCNHEAPILAMHETGQGFWQEGNIAGTLRAEGGPSNVIAQAFQCSQSGARVGETSATLRSSTGGGVHDIGILGHSTVRRLTPIECERLQGFQDDWTKIPWRGASAENCPDGPRYKAIGNSMAVPVMRWIGERIEKYGQ